MLYPCCTRVILVLYWLFHVIIFQKLLVVELYPFPCPCPCFFDYKWQLKLGWEWWVEVGLWCFSSHGRDKLVWCRWGVEGGVRMRVSNFGLKFKMELIRWIWISFLVYLLMPYVHQLFIASLFLRYSCTYCQFSAIKQLPFSTKW